MNGSVGPFQIHPTRWQNNLLLTIRPHGVHRRGELVRGREWCPNRTFALAQGDRYRPNARYTLLFFFSFKPGG